MHDRDHDIVFDETQHAWLNRFLLTIIAIESVILTAILGAIAFSSSGPVRTEVLIAWAVCVVGLPTLILGFRLRTRVDDDTLRVWFPPLRGWRIDHASIAHAEHRTAKPLNEMGGWGFKYAKKFGQVRNVYGEDFVTITLHNGKRRTIGTQRPDELLTAIRVLAQLPADESELIESPGATACPNEGGQAVR